MLPSPAFTCLQDHIARTSDAAFWRPYVTTALARHALVTACEPVPGHNATYPTFICGDLVVKLFGYSKAWQRSHAHECATYKKLATDPKIAAPSLVASGNLYDTPDAPWPYLITTRMPGIPARQADLSLDQQHVLAAAIGHQVKRLHALPPTGVATTADWPDLDVAAANAQGSLPPHLTAQIDAYLATLPSPDLVITHGDITANHVYVTDTGRLTGIIDWGDAMVTDRHTELIQPYRDLFNCHKPLFKTFLDAAAWPTPQDFPRVALAYALHRQTFGLAQHHTMDVFEPIAERHDLAAVPTLDALATELFSL